MPLIELTPAYEKDEYEKILVNSDNIQSVISWFGETRIKFGCNDWIPVKESIAEVHQIERGTLKAILGANDGQ